MKAAKQVFSNSFPSSSWKNVSKSNYSGILSVRLISFLLTAKEVPRMDGLRPAQPAVGCGEQARVGVIPPSPG